MFDVSPFHVLNHEVCNSQFSHSSLNQLTTLIQLKARAHSTFFRLTQLLLSLLFQDFYELSILLTFTVYAGSPYVLIFACNWFTGFLAAQMTVCTVVQYNMY